MKVEFGKGIKTLKKDSTMKKSRFTEKQILQVLRELEGGMPAAELSRKHGVSNATIYNWRAKYGGMTESELKKLRQLQEENHRLKRMYADLSIDHEILKDVIAKKL
jgi:putative transposase